jgi:RHS repeat-associated protein
LMVTDTATHFAGHDGNGNVMLLASADTATITAQYEYSPFGKVIRASGTMADANPIRFSGKYEDSESGYNYYGYRFYNPDAGRWLNRDPIGERGGPNETCFVNNAPTFYYDFLGLVGGIGIAWPNNHFVPPSMPYYPPFNPQPPSPGPQGNNISLLWPGLGCCNNPQRQLPITPTIPGAVTPPSRPIPGNGVSAGHHQTFPSGTAAGSGGAGPCIVIVIKCANFVTVFHFYATDNVSATLSAHSFIGCDAIMCGGNNQAWSICAANAVSSQAQNRGINIVGVSGSSSCGVTANGNWWSGL